MRFDEAIKSYGFDQNVDEPCVYKQIKGIKVVFIILYVDDLLIIVNDVELMTNIKNWLAKQFQMKDLGEESYVLRTKLISDRKNRLLTLYQASFTDKVLIRFFIAKFQER